MNRWAWCLIAISMTVGCRAPIPRLRDAFSAAGPTRVASPPTGSYTKPDPYYPGAGGLSPPRASTTAIPPTPPYNPTAGANNSVNTRASVGAGPAGIGNTSQPSGRFVAPPIMDVGSAPRVRISRNSTQGNSFQSLNTGGMVATDLSREPSRFAPSAGMLDIGDLPPVGANGSRSIALPGTFGAYPQPSVASDAWESRR